MKTINRFFVAIYSLILLGTIWLGIEYAYRGGLDAVFGDDLLLGIGFILAIILSIYFHYKLSKKEVMSMVHMIALGVTAIAFVFFVILVMGGLTCKEESCLGLIMPMFATLALWALSFILAFIAVVTGNKSNIS